jgi:hypothetical protein|tara:strand:+ start:3508 stop:3801 length:294 start_codon:yes stop_codon:yes gene_type:complete
VVVKSKHISCHGCKLNNNDYCYWFNKPKKIPLNIINKGCKHRDPYYVEVECSDIIASIINIFDGEFVDTPTEKRLYRQSKEWWKQKPKHKYTERKDW